MSAQVNQIWKEHHDMLLNFIRKRVTDENDADDILQEVFLKILSRINRLKNQEKLKSWLFQITRNTISDFYRLKAKENKPLLEKEEESELTVNAMQEVESWIGLYIHALPENYKQALILSELQGLPIKEVANKLGISYTNARARITRGRKALKKDLTDCCTFHVDAYGNVIDYHKNNSQCKNCD